MNLTSKNTLNDIFQNPLFGKIKHSLMGCSDDVLEYFKDVPFSVLEQHAGWPVSGLLKGLNRLEEIMTVKERYFKIYDAEQCRVVPECENVDIIHFPAIGERADNKPYILLCAGGAYTMVSSMLEAFPVAAEFNKLGYDCFVLTYRVGGKALLPKPIDDLAAAVSFIRKNEKEFNICGDHYIVCGFSAGGNLACQWATVNHGYKNYNLPKPRAIFAIYPATDFSLFPDNDNTENFLITMFGDNYSPNQLSDYNILEHIDGNCPPFYIACCMDDQAVPYQSSVLLKNRLDILGVANCIEVGNKGGHGFGDGQNTDCNEWYKRAVKFSEEL